MFPVPRIAAVIPCHNEAATIHSLVKAIQCHVAQVIVIDDGSSDTTAENALSAGAQIIRNATAQGKGAALQLGWKRASKEGFTHALTLDGDGQHSPNDVPKFLQALSHAPLVIGNRMPEKHKMPMLRRFVNGWMSRRLSRLAGRELPDTQCGFRLIDLHALSQLQVASTHFEIESELLLSFVRAGYDVHFVPVEVIYNAERSKIRPLRDTIRWFKWLRNVSQTKASVSGQLSSAGKTVVASEPASLAENV